MKHPCRPAVLFALVFVLSFAAPVSAQQSPAVVGSTVSGRVICADTGRPARFALVALYGAPAQLTPAVTSDAKLSGPQLLASLKASATDLVQTETNLDGSFTASGVAPGDYYVFAAAPGYLQPKDIVQTAYDAGANLLAGIPGVPMVHVVSNGSSFVDVTLERGAAISGKVTWNDGEPVAMAQVSVVPAKGKEKRLPAEFTRVGIISNPSPSSVSNDLGQYRVSGLRPGDYLVRATLQTGIRSTSSVRSGVFDFSLGSPFTVFAPATIHQADAKPVALRSSANVTGEDLVINLSDMYAVSGSIISAADRHGISSGMVTLQDTRDRGFSRSAEIGADGKFTVSLVPPGNYNLVVTNARDTAPPQQGGSFATTLRRYRPRQQTVIVTENNLSGLEIDLALLKVNSEATNR